jgi:rhodanese-related sulfurtransferase
MKHSIMTAVIFAFALFPTSNSYAQEAGKSVPISAAALSNFVKAHSGPVLDVRMGGDCDANQSLKRTTDRIGFDFGPPDPDGKKMALDLFMSKVRSSKSLVAAKQAGTTVLVVCCAGGRSEAAALMLAENGFKVTHVPGGMQGEKIPSELLKSK